MKFTLGWLKEHLDTDASVQEVAAALTRERLSATNGQHIWSVGFGEAPLSAARTGLQEFGLNHLDRDTLERAFVDFRPYLGKCRFNNCRHLREPDCAVLGAVGAGAIIPARLEVYHKLMGELAYADGIY